MTIITAKEKTSLDAKRTRRIAWIILLISGLYVVATSAWIITENREIITAMEILTIWAALTMIQFMVELQKASSEKKKSQSTIALILTVCMAVVTIANHVTYMTVLSQLYAANDMPSWLLLDGWPSVTKGLECVSWGFFLGLAMLFASDALADVGSKLMSWTLRISGILTLAGLIGPVLGNMGYYIVSTIGYSVGFLVLSIEMIIFLNRNEKKLDTIPNNV